MRINNRWFLVLVIALLTIKMSAQVSTDKEVIEVFNFVFDDSDTSTLGSITSEDKSKANLFVKELTEKSCALSYSETLITSAVSPSRTLQGIVKAFIENNYTKSCDDLKGGKIYESVRATLKRNWKSAFEIRTQTGEW